MNIESFRDYCLSLPNVDESLPFDDTTLVYKVGGKMFAMISMERPDRFSVKCDPDRSLVLRSRHQFVRAAYHMNKRHWNDWFFSGTVADEELRREIRHSLLLVVRKNVSPKTLRMALLAEFERLGVKDDADRFELEDV